MKTRLDLTGQRFSRLTAVSSVPEATPSRWLCRCECGKEVEVETGALRSGNTTSCGCSRRTHGGSKSPEYRSWLAMRHRCGVKAAYASVSVCRRWDKFENFLRDMGRRPEGMTLDRLDNSKGYSPANCRWATKQQQSINRGTTKFLSFDGKTLCIAAWARDVGLHEDTLRRRINKGWSLADALRRPVKGKK